MKDPLCAKDLVKNKNSARDHFTFLLSHLLVLCDLCLTYGLTSVGIHVAVNPSEPQVSVAILLASGEIRVLLIHPSGFLGVQDEPCLNNGSCQITWNDFNCFCPIDFTGRMCETRIWCVNEPCFDGARCVDLPDGFECKLSPYHTPCKLRTHISPSFMYLK